jgi:hypothetical protein
LTDFFRLWRAIASEYADGKSIFATHISQGNDLPMFKTIHH